MMYLVQGAVNTAQLLSFFVVDTDGWLVDAYAVEYRIIDPDGAQVEPVAGWTDVTSIGNFDTGAYFAVDPDTEEGWTVPADAAEGTWRIDWRWKETSAATTWSTWSLRFDVVASYDALTGLGFQGLGYRSLISPLRVRAEGLTTADASDLRVEELISEVQAYIEEATRTWFRPVLHTFRMSGPHSHQLFLQVAIIGLTSVTVNRSSATSSHDAIAVNFARTDLTHRFMPKPDARRNPNIAFRRGDTIYSGVTPNSRLPAFAAGALNQEVKGVFGFLESDGTVPALVQRAALRVLYATAVRFSASDVDVAGPVASETTDRHSVSYASGGGAPAATALARVREVDEIVRMYRLQGLGTSAPTTAFSRLV